MGDYFNITQTPDSTNLIIYPDGVDNYDNSIVSYGSSSSYECIDEIWSSPNDDTDYISSTASSTVSIMFTMENHSSETGNINYVRSISRARSVETDQNSTGSYRIIIYDGSSSSYSDNKAPLNTTYKKYYSTWTNKPSGGNWTWNDIDNIKTGIEMSSPSVVKDNTAILNPNGEGHYTQWSPNGETNNWECVDDGIIADGSEYIEDNESTYEKDTYTVENHNPDTHIGTIKYIRVYYNYKTPGAVQIQPMIRINGTDAYGTYRSSGANHVWNYDQWWTNPDSSSSWTWSDIDNLEIGVRKNQYNPAYVRTIYLAVYSDKSFPEIRTTQLYNVVNYTPTSSTVSLSIPDQLSVSHSRDISRFNFPDGDYEIADMGRSGKTLNISGIEYNSTVSDMQSVKDFCHYGSKVSVTNLPDSNLNTDYLIRSFSWNDISFNNETQNRVYRWNLQLEES